MKYQQLDGIQFCRAHDDFAIEGYDWSDICYHEWAERYIDGPKEACDLVPMFVEEAGQ